MVTIFDVQVPLFSQCCPENQTKDTCPLRQWVQQDGTYKLFDNYRLLPDTHAWIKARNAINTMYEICSKCQSAQEQHTR